MKAIITRPDGTKIEVEGTAEEINIVAGEPVDLWKDYKETRVNPVPMMVINRGLRD